MNGRFITWVIIGVSFGFTQLWFAYWVVKLFKGVFSIPGNVLDRLRRVF